MKIENTVCRSLCRPIFFYGRVVTEISFDLNHIPFGWNKEKKLPKAYFDNAEFLYDEAASNNENIKGALGLNPAPEQLIKYERCRAISKLLDEKKLDLLAAQKITSVNSTDISRIRNFHIDRFTIDRLIKIYTNLDNKKKIRKFFAVYWGQNLKISLAWKSPL